MQRIHKSIDIKSPAQRIFDFLMNPKNLPHIWPSLIEVSNVKLTESEREYDWVYKMAGLHFRGHSSKLESQPGKLLRWRDEGGIVANFRWAFEGRDGSTTVTCDLEYTIPGKVLGRVAEMLAAKLNEHEAQSVLENLKATMEAPAKAPEVTAQPHA